MRQSLAIAGNVSHKKVFIYIPTSESTRHFNVRYLSAAFLVSCSAFIKCGDRIRLQHVATKRFLHSHHFQSPLSSQQEISCYGEEGVGDSGDNWDLLCHTGEWLRDQAVQFRHIDTGAYLAVSGRTFGRPINGQMEVIGASHNGHAAEWKSAEGLFIHPREPTSEGGAHDEL